MTVLTTTVESYHYLSLFSAGRYANTKLPLKSSLSTNSNTSSFISELPGFDKSKFIPSETSSPLPIHKTIGSPDPNELRAALARCSADKKVRLLIGQFFRM